MTAFHRLIDLEWGLSLPLSLSVCRLTLLCLLLPGSVELTWLARLLVQVSVFILALKSQLSDWLAVICPGIIYGQGRGPQKIYSVPWYSLTELALSQQRATYAAKGTNKWAVVSHLSSWPA